MTETPDAHYRDPLATSPAWCHSAPTDGARLAPRDRHGARLGRRTRLVFDRRQSAITMTAVPRAWSKKCGHYGPQTWELRFRGNRLCTVARVEDTTPDGTPIRTYVDVEATRQAILLGQPPVQFQSILDCGWATVAGLGFYGKKKKEDLLSFLRHLRPGPNATISRATVTVQVRVAAGKSGKG